MTEQEVTELAELFQKIGYSKKLHEVLREEDAARVIEAFIKKDPFSAYRNGTKIGDAELMKKAGESLIETDPDLTIYAVHKSGNVAALNRAGWAALKETPSLAYTAGMRTRDKELVREAGWKLLGAGYDSDEQYQKIYVAGLFTGDNELITAVEDAFVEYSAIKEFDHGTCINNYSAVNEYDLGTRTNNERLIEKARKKLIKNDPIGAAIFGKSRSDLVMVDDAGWQLLKQDCPVEAYKAGQYSNDRKLVEEALEKIAASSSESIKGTIKQLYRE